MYMNFTAYPLAMSFAYISRRGIGNSWSKSINISDIWLIFPNTLQKVNFQFIKAELMFESTCLAMSFTPNIIYLTWGFYVFVNFIKWWTKNCIILILSCILLIISRVGHFPHVCWPCLSFRMISYLLSFSWEMLLYFCKFLLNHKNIYLCQSLILWTYFHKILMLWWVWYWEVFKH